MAALTAERDTLELSSAFSQRVGDYGGGVVVASDEIYKGAMMAFDQSDDKIKPAETSTTLVVIGRAEESFSSPVGNTDIINVRSGIFGYENSAGGDEIFNASAGLLCYAVDDQTVALTNGSSTRSVAGVVYKVVGSTVYVSINPSRQS